MMHKFTTYIIYKKEEEVDVPNKKPKIDKCLYILLGVFKKTDQPIKLKK